MMSLDNKFRSGLAGLLLATSACSSGGMTRSDSSADADGGAQDVTSAMDAMDLGPDARDAAPAQDGTSAMDATDAMDLGPDARDAAPAQDVMSAMDAADATDAMNLGPDARDAAPARDVPPSVPGSAVNLRSAGNFVILAKTGISSVPQSAITGNIGVSPAAATYLTGFSLTADRTNEFSTSRQLTGRAYASDYAVPTPANLTAAVSDMETAFTDAAGRAASVTELGAGNVGGMTLRPAVYAWGTGLLIPSNITLNGSATDVWIFQIAQNLTISNGVRVVLSGGAVAQNVFWQVAGSVSIGTTAHCEGVILTRTAVTMRTRSTLNGRILAQTAVTIDGATVVQPAR